MEKAEAFCQFVWNQIAETDIVDEHQQLDVRLCPPGWRVHRNVVRDDRDFSLKVDAESLVGRQDWLDRADERIGSALIHEWVGPERWRQFGTARFAHKLDVRDIGRAVGPLISAGQRRCAVNELERQYSV